MKTVLKFLLATSAISTVSAANFYYNQVAYDLNLPKTLVVKSNANLLGTAFSIKNDRGVEVFTGTFGMGSTVDNWTREGSFYLADFSALLEVGNFTLSFLENGNNAVSSTLKITNNALQTEVLQTLIGYFELDKNKDADTNVPLFSGGGKSVDVHGGWDDASGDVSKYLSHLSYANYLNPQQIPLTTWSMAFATEKMPSVLQSINMLEQVQNLATYGADFLVRMQDEAGYFYMTIFDNWGAGRRYVCAFSGSDGQKSNNFQTAYREGGGMAIAGLAKVSTLGKNGDYESIKYFETAVKGFENLESVQQMDGVCTYCDNNKENIIDDYTALMAAVELYNASLLYAPAASTTYLESARKRANHLAARLSSEGYFWSDDEKTRPFWHASDAGLPLVALVRYLEIESDASVGASILGAVSKHLNWLIAITNKVENPFGYARQIYKTGGNIKEGFFIPHDNESNYWWQGENARLGSLAAAALYAANALGNMNASVQKYAIDQLDWILGKNPYGECFMEGKGVKNPPEFHGTYGYTYDGGIVNGITGYNTDGSGIAYNNTSELFPLESWQNWRWIEQWLPHATWFFLATTSLYDEVKFKPAYAAESLPQLRVKKFSYTKKGNVLNIQLSSKFGNKIALYDLKGVQIFAQNIDGTSTQLKLPHAGTFILKVNNQSVLLK